MALALDYFFSLRSPYSYLSVPRIATLEREHELDVAVRIVLPLAVRDDRIDLLIWRLEQAGMQRRQP